MKNNQYTATPNWFKDVQQQQQVVTTQTNYYIGGASGGGGLQSINLYNKFKIESYRITVDDLLINNNAIIAADTPLVEGEERPEDFVSEIGNNVEAENWHTSYLISVVPSTNLVANLKANSNRYGIVFYDEYNQPISGHTPIKDELVTIDVPEKARYFRCCHYIEPVVESVEEPVEPTYEFYIEYTGMGNYEDSDLNTAYGGIFENFTNVNSSVPEGINTKQLSTSGLNLIFQQPLSCTVDKNDNIKIGLDKVFTDSIGNIETIQGLWKLIEDEQGNKYIITDYNIVGKGGITAYYNDDLNPGGSGGLGGGGSIANIQVIGKGNAISDVTLSEDKSLLTFTKLEVVQKDWITAELRKYVTLDTAQIISGAKTFTSLLTTAAINASGDISTPNVRTSDSVYINGIRLYKSADGTIKLDGNLLVTGGITAYSTGEEGGGSSGGLDVNLLWEILGGTGTQQINITHLTDALTWNNISSKPSWIGSTKPSYNWSEIGNKPTTLGGYGITDAYTKTDSDNRFVNVSGDTMTGGLTIQRLTISHSNEINSSDYVFLGYRDTINGVNVCFNNKPFTYGSSRHTVWHAGNDGSGSGLDADLLDGKHASSFLTNANLNSGLTNKDLDYATFNFGSTNKGDDNEQKNVPTKYGAYLSITQYNINCGAQLFFDTVPGSTGTLYFRTRNSGDRNTVHMWKSWKTVIDSTNIGSYNAGSATKLQTARTIWGQPFDGKQNVTGALTSVTNITASGSISCNTITTTGSVTTGGNITISNGSGSKLTIWDSSAYLMQQSISDLGGYGLYLYGANGTRIANKLVVDSNAYLKGNVGIGTISPSAKLHVIGNILATGGITCYSSDQRAKTVIEQIKLSLKQIANAPTIRFKWNDWKIKDDGKTHIGGIAQYMQQLLPETVLEADDMLNMDYSTTAYIFSVQTARHLQTYETRTDRKIRKLEKEVLYLKNQLKKLGYEEADIMDD